MRILNDGSIASSTCTGLDISQEVLRRSIDPIMRTALACDFWIFEYESEEHVECVGSMKVRYAVEFFFSRTCHRVLYSRVAEHVVIVCRKCVSYVCIL